MASAPRIAVVGSAITDLTMLSEVFPRAGETVFGKSFNLGFGGKGANQAVAARHLGAEVRLVAKVGADVFGEATLRNLATAGIDTSYVQSVHDCATGVASIFVEPGGQNRIMVVKGANDRLTAADVDAAAPGLAGVDTIILQFEIPLDTVYHTIRFARANNIKCIVNPAPALPVDLQELTGAEYLILNETEVELLTGRPARTLREVETCATALVEKGFAQVLVTLGASGSLAADARGCIQVPAFPVAAVDTTGAGDAFIGSVAVFLAKGMSLRDAMLRASLYAALSTTKIGAQSSFPLRTDFEAQWTRCGAGVLKA